MSAEKKRKNSLNGKSEKKNQKHEKRYMRNDKKIQCFPRSCNFTLKLYKNLLIYFSEETITFGSTWCEEAGERGTR